MSAGTARMSACATTTFDLCVIGGGATGAGCALDGQLRGLRTILIEAGDFGSGASSASTKMAHGGIRYLQAAVAHFDIRQYRLVRHALAERALMLRNAPHLAKPMEFVIPCRSLAEQVYYGLGTRIYDWVAGSAGLSPSRSMNAQEALRRVPALNPNRLAGAVSYADGQFDDARYCLALVTTFVEKGGVALNYVRATGFEKTGDGKIAAVSTGSATIRARAFVNATGPYSDGVRRMASPGAPARLRPSKGVHLLFPLDGWGSDGMVVPKTEDGRVVFALPYNGRLMVGTTDDEASPDAEMVVTRREIDYLLRQINPYLETPLQASQMVSGFAGIRPLVRSAESGATARLIRDDEVEVDRSTGLISILGGKWTTYRLMAERTIDRVQQELGLPVGGSTTATTRLAGSVGRAAALAGEALSAAVVHAVRHEMALTVEDVLARRIGLQYYDWRMAMDAAPVVAALMARELGWQSDETTRASDEYRARIAHLLETAGLSP